MSDLLFDVPHMRVLAAGTGAEFFVEDGNVIVQHRDLDRLRDALTEFINREQPEAVVLSVRCTPDGNVTIEGPLHNKKLCNWLIQCLREAVVKHSEKPKSLIVLPGGAA